MQKKFLSTLLGLALVSSLFSGEGSSIGVVNFSTCFTDSKHGKKEQENFESLRNQLSSLIENTEGELKEIAVKFEDSEFVDSLSPKAEEEMRMKEHGLREDLARYQGQFYQMMNQAQYQMMQRVSSMVGSAAEKVAKEHQLDYVINRDACFYIRDNLDITTDVISKMDEKFDLETAVKKESQKKEAALVEEGSEKLLPR